MSNPIYALILAGGSGQRFWPLSRRNRPKQLLRLVSERTLLEEAVARLENFVSTDRILILTNVEQEKAVRDLLKEFPKENIIAEPAKRDTAAAVALGAGWVAARDHSATMLAFPADHVIADRTAFLATMKTAAAAAEETGALVTIGIKPTWACPGFGYIEQGEAVKLRGEDKIAVHRVIRFREKPNVDLAESFLRKGNFRWNAGMFCGNGSPSCRGSLSITRSWKRPNAFWLWKRPLTGMTSAAGSRWHVISKRTSMEILLTTR